MLVSVVIPAYNSSTALEGSVSSVLGQSHEELEVIVVDDGSRDDTLQVARSLAASDSRVHVVTKENGGVSSARNAGLDVAVGDVVLFVDADDALVPGALSYVCRRFSEDDLDCLVFGMLVEPEELTPLTLAHRLAPRDVVVVDDARRLIFVEHSHPYAFRVAFSRDFLIANELCFDTSLSLGEDEAFLLTAYRLARNVALSSRQLYVYQMSDQSASHKDNASDEVLPAKLEKHLALVFSVMGEWKQRGFDRSCDADLLDWCLDLLMLDVSRLTPEQQIGFYDRLWNVLVGYYGPDGGRSVARGAAGPCLRSIQMAAFGGKSHGPVIDRLSLVRFYVSSRGMSAVAERALATLKGKGAYS